MVAKSREILTPGSYDDVDALVRVSRDPKREFYSFELFEPVQVDFENGKFVVFLPSDMVTYFSKRALFLATFNSSTHSISIKRDHSAEITERDLTNPDVFNTWIQRIWSLERPDRQ